jgi:site-specific recombinase XerD
MLTEIDPHAIGPDDEQARIPATVPAGESLPLPAREVAAAADYARAEKAAATRRAYRSDFEIFHAWCAERYVSALPASPESVAAFLAHEAERQVRPSTIGRRVAAIRYAHKLAGLPVPTDDERVRATVRGIRRSLGAAPSKKMPATAERVIGMAPLAGTRLSAVRDRALLLIGFAGAFRRSELVALNADDIEETADGLRLTIRRSKTDQEGHGHVIAIPRGVIACPVTALRAWLEAAAITEGPGFRPIATGGRIQATRLTDRSVADIVKAHALRAGLDPKLFAGHSLRSGFLTSAAARGASIFKMADQSRHKNMDTLRGYVRVRRFSRTTLAGGCYSGKDLKLCQCHGVKDERGAHDKAYRPAHYYECPMLIHLHH